MKPFMTNIAAIHLDGKRKLPSLMWIRPLLRSCVQCLHANLIFVPSYIVLTLIIMCCTYKRLIWVIVNVSGVSYWACHWEKKGRYCAKLFRKTTWAVTAIAVYCHLFFFFIFILMWCSVIMAYWVIIVTSCHVQWCQKFKWRWFVLLQK